MLDLQSNKLIKKLAKQASHNTHYSMNRKMLKKTIWVDNISKMYRFIWDWCVISIHDRITTQCIVCNNIIKSGKMIIFVYKINSMYIHTCTMLAVVMILSDHILENYQTVQIVALLRVCNFLEPQIELWREKFWRC